MVELNGQQPRPIGEHMAVGTSPWNAWTTTTKLTVAALLALASVAVAVLYF